MWLFGGAQHHLPVAKGPFTPGCMDVMFDYEKSGLFARFYYPTSIPKNQHNLSRWLQWLPDDNYLIGSAKVLMISTFVIRSLFWWTAGIIPVIYGAKMDTKKPLKCVVLSHGLGAHRAFYSNVCCDLASRGFLVVALEHRDSSACHTFYYASKEDAQNDRPTPIEFKHLKLGKGHYEKRNEQALFRATECAKAIFYLKQLNEGCALNNIMNDVPSQGSIDFKLGDFLGRLDVGSVTMMGHSFGGASALLALTLDEDFRQCILLDPWMFPIKNAELHNKITQPLLFINTQTFHIGTNVEAMSKFLNNDADKPLREMYTILHTTHESQTDSALLLGYWLNWFMKKLPPEVALKINNALIFRFLSQQVGFPSDGREWVEILDEEKENVVAGLTKPWA